MTSAALLECADISLRFSGVVALERLSVSVQIGETLGVIGPNGSGKTSLINCITGFYRPTSGDIMFGGSSLVGQRPDRIARRGVARTFQNVVLLPRLSIWENVMLGRYPRTSSGFVANMLHWPAMREERANRSHALEVLRALDLEDRAESDVASLPYGIRKLVEVARALASEPQLVLLDEPVAGMNDLEKSRMAEVIQKVRGERAVTFVVVEHDVDFVSLVSDRVVALEVGRVIAEGRPDAVLRDARVVDAYLGAPMASNG
jgi:branched-chain amino acid transport system ATP-binding protein